MKNAGYVGGRPVFVLEEGDTYESYMSAQRSYRKALVNKWAWLLEGTKKMAEHMTPLLESQYEAMAMVLENQQAVHMGIIEATKTTDISMPQKYTLPIIRKVFPALLAWKVASVQPMPMSSGGIAQIFYQDFLREDVSPETSTTAPDSDYAWNIENGVPKRIKMEITSETIQATKDILAATWSTEVQEDARGTLGIDVEAELIAQCAQEILRELDTRMIIEILLGASAGNATWAWTIPAGIQAKEHYETLGHALVDMDDLLFGARYRRGDWIIAGRTVCSYMRKMQTFVPEPRNNVRSGQRFSMGTELIGRVTGYWDVYESSMSAMLVRAIMGVYPTTQIDTGYIFAPYVPLTPMPLIYGEFMAYDDATLPGAYVNTDKWSRNIRTRNAKKMVVGDLFCTLTISA